MDEVEYYVGKTSEIERLLGLSIASLQWPQLRKENVPEALWELLPLAYDFGIEYTYRPAPFVEQYRSEEIFKVEVNGGCDGCVGMRKCYDEAYCKEEMSTLSNCAIAGV